MEGSSGENPVSETLKLIDACCLRSLDNALGWG